MDKNFKWRTDFAKNIFYYRYAQGPDDTWPKLCRRLVEDVCGSRFGQEAINLLSKDDRDLLVKYMIEMKFIPGGRYLYYSGRPKHFFNNCFSFLAEEDTREEWARLVHDVTACLMSGGGVGVVYDVLRPSGYTLRNTGGTSSGPLSLMKMINEIGRYVIQGGSRRCLPEWAPVQMYDGTILPIKNIEVGDLVHTRFGPKKVINKFDQGKQQVYKIETNTGDLFSTKNHRWWGAGKDRTPRWVTTANIKRGYKIYREYAKKLFGIPIDTNWAYTLGFFLGNGCAYSSGYTHEVTFQLADKHITEGQIATILLGMETVTDAKPTIRKGHGACTEIRYRRRTLVKEFQKYKKPHTMFTIPYEIKNADLETRSAFLAGWFDADGDIRKDNIIRLSNKYEHTLLEARILLKTLGIYSRLNKVGNIYSLNLSARQINRFKETIGKYSHKYDPRSSDNAHQPNLFSIVKSVEPYDICQTYDLEIEDVHEFVAFDHISHNSALWAGLNWQHEDIYDFLVCKDYPEEHRKLKEQDFNFPLPMDMTNISINWDTDFAEEYLNTGEVTNCDLWMQSVRKMMKTGEPGHAYNFYENEEEVGRNAPVAGDTYVLTSSGYVQVKDIIEQPIEIWTGKRFAKTVFKCTKKNTETIKIVFSGGRSITCDPDHEFFVDEFTKIKAKDLTIGTPLYVSLPKRQIQSFDKTFYTYGFLYGDGSFSAKLTAECSICCDEKQICAEYFDKKLISSVTKNDKRGYDRYYFKVNSIYNNKNILPNFESVKQKCSFIAGLFDADGNISCTHIRLANMDFKFLKSIQRLLEDLGILANITTAGMSSFSDKQCYSLNILHVYKQEFLTLIPTKRLKLNNLSNKKYNYFVRVIDVVPDVRQDVYCCDVGVPEHSFQAEGIIVSNCNEYISDIDSNVCNLGSINFANIQSLEELGDVVYLASKFLYCGTIRGEVPTEKIRKVRDMRRQLGMGVMGIHEWLLARGHRYEMVPELEKWFACWKTYSEVGANEVADKFSLPKPHRYRAIAPAGTIGILASTTTGIEPMYAVAYKRRFIVDGNKHKYQYVVDATAQRIIDEYGIAPDKIETASDLAFDPERRVKFQADVQKYVDMGISSTINLPAWGTEYNNEDRVQEFANIFAKYATSLRGITVYPDGARGGQPLNSVPYEEAKKQEGYIFDEAEEKCSGGICSI